MRKRDKTRVEPRRNFTSLWNEDALFDLESNHVNRVPDLATAIDDMLISLSRPAAGQEQVRKWVGNGAQVLVRRALTGRVDWENAEPLDEALFREANERFYQHYETVNGTCTTVFDGV